jgi:hypothetical protein
VIVIIQCAATKHAEAGRMKSADSKSVVFVAEPKSAPPPRAHSYARPDDMFDAGKSWREALLDYNRRAKSNPLGLYPAYRLYKNQIYERLVDRLGLNNVYILSAGWGLIRADFLTPYYDITFSQSADGFKRRRKTDRYLDFSMLPDRPNEEIVFFGGKDYLPLLCSLTGETPNRKPSSTTLRARRKRRAGICRDLRRRRERTGTTNVQGRFWIPAAVRIPVTIRPT